MSQIHGISSLYMLTKHTKTVIPEHTKKVDIETVDIR